MASTQPATEFYPCTVCQDSLSSTTLEPHQYWDDTAIIDAPGVPDSHWIGDWRTAMVCSPCHRALHTVGAAQLSDIVYDRRPPCPACGAHRAAIPITGMLPGPPPPGYIATGCVIFTDDPAPDYQCQLCGHEWNIAVGPEHTPS